MELVEAALLGPGDRGRMRKAGIQHRGPRRTELTDRQAAYAISERAVSL